MDWLLVRDAGQHKFDYGTQSSVLALALAIEPGGTRRLAEAGQNNLIRIREGGGLQANHAFRAHDRSIAALAGIRACRCSPAVLPT